MLWLIIIPLAVALILAAFMAGRRSPPGRSNRMSKMRRAQNSALDIIRQNTDALRSIERALDNNSEALRRLSRSKKEE